MLIGLLLVLFIRSFFLNVGIISAFFRLLGNIPLFMHLLILKKWVIKHMSTLLELGKCIGKL